MLIKFWIHVSRDEQERRFNARKDIPHKRWKLTAEDWRNREKWDQYELAVHDMVERTSTQIAPWVLVPGNDKQYARCKVLEVVGRRLKQAVNRAVKLEKETVGRTLKLEETRVQQGLEL